MWPHIIQVLVRCVWCAGQRRVWVVRVTRDVNWGMIQNFLVVQLNSTGQAAAEPNAENLVTSPPFYR
jgi:hypothetical protein